MMETDKDTCAWKENRRAFLKAALLVSAAIPVAATLKTLASPPPPPLPNQPGTREAEFYRRIN
jgi:hypothetical protein